MNVIYCRGRMIGRCLFSFLQISILICFTANAYAGPEDTKAISSANFVFSKANACPNEQFTVTYTGTYVGTPTFNWNFGDAVIHSGSGQGPYVISYAGPYFGSKVISLSVTDNNGTASFQDYPFIYTPVPITVSATHSSVRSLCTTRLNASGAVTYNSWSPAPDNIVPSGQSAVSAPNAYVTPAAATTYTITGTDINGCATSGSVNIGLTSTPFTGISTTKTNFCITSDPHQMTLDGGATLGNVDVSPSGLFIYTPDLWIMPGQSSTTPNVYTVTSSIPYPGTNPYGWACPVIPSSSVTITMSAPSVINDFDYPAPWQYCNDNTNTFSPTLNATNISGSSVIAYTSSPAGLNINASTGVITPSGSTAGTYAVTVSITNGVCAPVTAQTTITIGEKKDPNFSYPTGGVYCATGAQTHVPTMNSGLPWTGNLLITGSSGGTTIIGGNGQVSIPSAISLLNNIAYQNINQLNYTLTNTIPAAAGCPAVTSTPVYVTINRRREAQAFHFDGSYRICAGGVSTVAAGAIPNAPGEWGTFSSSPSGLSMTSAGLITVTSSIPNTYTITHDVTGGVTGCMISTTKTVTILPKPVITPATINACSGVAFSHTFQGVPAIGMSLPTWTASATPAGSVTGFTASGMAATLNQTLTTVNGGTVTYNVTPQDNGCNGDPTPIVVNVYPKPVITTITNKTICGNNVSLNQTIASANVPTATFSWTSSTANAGITGYTNGTGSVISDQIFNTGTQGVVSYTATGTKDGCTGSTNFTVTVNPVPALTGSVSKLDPCPMESITFTYSRVVGAPYTYSHIIPAGYQVVNTNNSNPAQTVLTILAGTSQGTIGVTATNTTNNCPNTYSQQVTPKPRPVISVSNVTVCAGYPMTIPISSSNDPGAMFSWSTLNMPASVTGLPSTGSGAGISGTPEGSGTATYGVYAQGSNGCNTVAPVTVTATINANPLQSVTVSPSPICEGNQVVISVGTPANPPGFSYTITTVPAGFVYQGSGGSQYGYGVGFKVGATGGDFVVTSANATTTCSRVIPYPVVVIPAPAAPVVSVTATSGCQGDAASFTVQNPTGGIGISWTMQGGSILGSCGNNGTSQGCNFTFNGASGNLNVKATDPVTTCTATTSTYLTVKPYPIVNPVTYPSICSGATSNISLTSTVPGSSFSWVASQGAGSITGFSNGSGNTIQQTLTGSGSVYYDVTASNGNGCVAAASRIVQPVSTNTVSVSVTSNHPNITGQIPMGSIVFTANVTNGGSSPTYQWKVNNINKGTNSPTYSNPNLNPSVRGSGGDQVKCQVTSSISCTVNNPVTSNTVIIGCTYCRIASAPFEDKEDDNNDDDDKDISVTAYPNPFSGSINVRIPKEDKSASQVVITNLDGVTVESFTTNNDLVEAGQNLPAGVYILKVVSGSETTMTRIIKQ